MARWLGKKGDAGWTAVAVEADGLYGVTVLAPQKPGGKPRVVKCGAMPAGQLNAETLTGLSKKISSGGCPWTLSLSHKEYSILVIPEPAVTPDEFDQSIRWSIGTMVDYPVIEAGVSWVRIPTAEEMPSRPPHIYVMAAKNEIIAGYNAIFQRAKIPLQAIDVRETAQRNIAALAENQGEGLALLLIGKQGVQFTTTFNGALYLDRFVEESLFTDTLQDADAQARTCERIVLQVQRSLDFIGRTLSFIDIQRILMAPMPDKLDHGDFISQHLHVPVETLDLASIFDFSQTPELVQEENQARYFSALGAALRFMNKSRQINLLHEQRGKEFNFTWGMLAALGLMLVTLLGLWGVRQSELVKMRMAEVASARQLQEAKDRMQELVKKSEVSMGAEVAALKPQAEAARKILAQANTLGSQQGYARYFSALATIAEDELWLTNVKVDNVGKSVHLSGHALHEESVIRYAQQLNGLFVGYGVQFTALELNNNAAGKQANTGSQPTAVTFKLY